MGLSQIRKQHEIAAELLMGQVPGVVKVEVKTETCTTTYVKVHSTFSREDRNQVYKVEQILYHEFPDVNFDFNLIDASEATDDPIETCIAAESEKDSASENALEQALGEKMYREAYVGHLDTWTWARFVKFCLRFARTVGGIPTLQACKKEEDKLPWGG